MKTLFLLLMLFSATCLAQVTNIKADLTLTQKATTVSTDLFQIILYDNIKMSQDGNPDKIGSGYDVVFTFIAKSMSEEMDFKKLFYNGAECSVKFKMWDNKISSNCVIVQIKQEYEMFMITARGVSKMEKIKK